MLTDQQKLMLARGEYSTLTSERRELLKSARYHADRVIAAASAALTQASLSDWLVADSALAGASESLAALAARIERVRKVEAQRAKLRVTAWPDGKDDDE